MADLSAVEKRKLEKSLGMGSGYVLGFSNQTFADYFLDVAGIDIYDDKYAFRGQSKANRMRAFWEREDNYGPAPFSVQPPELGPPVSLQV